ncbi:MAG TPA: hypothetical protein VGK67_07855 [Myxococcales bacterium]
MRKGQLIGLIGLSGLAVLGFVVGCGDNPDSTFKPYVFEGKTPWDGGCPDPGINCPGEEAFECGMLAIRTSHARCSQRSDCIAATGPDPADCYSMCGHAPVNRGQEAAYLREANEEVFKYCNRSRCQAYLECPRPDNAEIDCVDAGASGLCSWVEGVFRFPDAGDTGTTPPDAAAPIPPDASTPEPPDADAPVPPDAAAPIPPDAAAPIPPDAAAPGLDAAPAGPDAAPPGLDADAPGLDAEAPGLDAAEPGLDAAAEPPDADPPDAP